MLELAHILLVTFSMDYQTKNVQNYDISNYNELFKDYVNENTTKVANDMKNLKLPVLGVQKVIMVRKCSIQCTPNLRDKTTCSDCCFIFKR